MKIPWKAVAHVGLNVAGQIFPAVQLVETIAGLVPALTGADKQNAVALLLQQSLALAPNATAQALAADPAIDRANRALIDAVVAYHNAVAAHAGAAAS